MFSIPVFEELVNGDHDFVIEQIYQNVNDCFHEFEIIQVDGVRVDSISEKISLHRC